MKLIFYRLLMHLSRRMGPWVFVVFSRLVAGGYFFCFPRRVAASLRFYRILFPDRHFLYPLWCAWRQYQNFTSVFLDRLLVGEETDISYESEGFDYLIRAMETGTGGIILMSHMGNWEVSAHLLKQKNNRLMLYVGQKEKEQIEAMQKRSLTQSGIELVVAGRGEGSPFDVLPGIHFLKGGGLVSLTGDRLWDERQRALTVEFAHHEVRLPEAPHMFALLSGAPILVFFVFRRGERQYTIKVYPPRYVRASSRQERQQAVQASAQAYAELLEEEVRCHPDEWYHFEPFLGKPWKA